ncbi:hypothetical protein, partial [Citrobacter braakii]|uniref:hypothetical protein n=1 Tax=Citrobacter braakii TaxID=57706 RepID=UPI0023B2A31D
YDRHRSVRLVVLVGLAIDQIAQSGLSSLSVIYYSAQLFREKYSRSRSNCLSRTRGSIAEQNQEQQDHNGYICTHQTSS